MAKLPLLKGEYAHVASKKDGSLKLLCGSDPLQPTDDDIFLVEDAQDPDKFEPVDHDRAREAVKKFITLKPDQYAIIHSPASSYTEEYPNGNWKQGKNDLIGLDYGAKRVVTSGSFPLWPGQSVEIRKVHELDSDQFLMVRVESSKIDEDAPYYQKTVECAGIKTAMVDATVDSEGDVASIPQQESPAKEDEEEGAETGSSDSDQNASSDGGEQKSAQDDETKPPKENKPESPPKKSEPKGSDQGGGDGADSQPITFAVGQKIIIPGSITETYVPPTGIEIVTEEAQEVEVEQPAPRKVKRLTSEDKLRILISQGQVRIETLEDKLYELDLEDNHNLIKREYSGLRDSGQSRDALFKAITSVLEGRQLTKLIESYGIISEPESENVNSTQLQTQPKADKDSAVYQAVVLGPTGYCVLVDENGKPTTHIGPGRVFPGPNDKFREKGSRGRVYDAYHLRPDRGLLLRVVAEKISKADLLKKLPPACEKQLEKDTYHKGDEIFIGGFDAYLVPHFNLYEVIDPTTQNPHIGNDHSVVYVQAIGVDQKSGIYVMNVETGNVELVEGEKKVLLDPRKKKHVTRTVPGKIWNLMVGFGEQNKHKRVDPDSMVKSPWAISVDIPNNMAILLTSRSGRRAVEGPQTVLLAFDEVPEVKKISTGRIKQEDVTKDIVFLWVTGNRPTDQVELITSDKAVIKVDVQYEVEFFGESDEEKQSWFLYQNYVHTLSSNTRSRLRNAAEQLTFAEIKDNISEFVRNVLLGKKPEGEDAHRPNLTYESSHLRVIEVEVLDWEVDDEDVAMALEMANKQSVTREIKDTAMKAELDSAKARDEINAEQADLEIKQAERSASTDLKRTQILDNSAAEKLKLDLEQTKRAYDSDVEKSKMADDASAAKEEVEKARTQRAAVLEVEKAKISDQAAEELAEIEKGRTARNQAVSLVKAESDAVIKEKTAELGRKLDLALATNHAELQLKKDEERTRASGVQREINEADTRSALALKDEARKAVATFRDILAKTSIELAKGEADADATRISALQEKLVEAIEGLGNKQVLAELAQHLPESSGPLGNLFSQGGVEALSKLLNGLSLKDGINALTATKGHVENAADNAASKTADPETVEE
ncbi:hypothetical protein ACFL2U_02775 [Patescibacteria group bacterium]